MKNLGIIIESIVGNKIQQYAYALLADNADLIKEEENVESSKRGNEVEIIEKLEMLENYNVSLRYRINEAENAKDELRRHANTLNRELIRGNEMSKEKEEVRIKKEKLCINKLESIKGDEDKDSNES